MADHEALPVLGHGGWPCRAVYPALDDAARLPDIPASLRGAALPAVGVWAWYPEPPVLIPTGRVAGVVDLPSRERAMQALEVSIDSALAMQTQFSGMRKWDAGQEGRLLKQYLFGAYPLRNTARVLARVLDGVGVRTAASLVAPVSTSPAPARVSMSITPLMPGGLAPERTLFDPLLRRLHRMVRDTAAVVHSNGGPVSPTPDEATLAAVFTGALVSVDVDGAPSTTSTGNPAETELGTAEGAAPAACDEAAETLLMATRLLALLYERIRVRECALDVQPAPPGKKPAEAPIPPGTTGTRLSAFLLGRLSIPPLAFPDVLPPALARRLAEGSSGDAGGVYEEPSVRAWVAAVFAAAPFYTRPADVRRAVGLWVDVTLHGGVGWLKAPDVAGILTAATDWVAAGWVRLRPEGSGDAANDNIHYVPGGVVAAMLDLPDAGASKPCAFAGLAGVGAVVAGLVRHEGLTATWATKLAGAVDKYPLAFASLAASASGSRRPHPAALSVAAVEAVWGSADVACAWATGFAKFLAALQQHVLKAKTVRGHVFGEQAAAAAALEAATAAAARLGATEGPPLLYAAVTQWLHVDSVQHKARDDPFAVPKVEVSGAGAPPPGFDAVFAKLREARAGVLHAAAVLLAMGPPPGGEVGDRLKDVVRAMLRGAWAAAEDASLFVKDTAKAAPRQGDAAPKKPKFPPPKKGSRAHHELQKQTEKDKDKAGEDAAPADAQDAAWPLPLALAALTYPDGATLLGALERPGGAVCAAVENFLHRFATDDPAVALLAVRCLAGLPEGAVLCPEEPTPSAAVKPSAKPAKQKKGKEAKAAGEDPPPSPHRPATALPQGLEEWVWEHVLLPAMEADAGGPSAEAEAVLAVCCRHGRVVDRKRFAAFLERHGVVAEEAPVAPGGKEKVKRKESDTPAGDAEEPPALTRLMAFCAAQLRSGAVGRAGWGLEVAAAVGKDTFARLLLADSDGVRLAALLRDLAPLLDDSEAAAVLALVADAVRHTVFALGHKAASGLPQLTVDVLPSVWLQGDMTDAKWTTPPGMALLAVLVKSPPNVALPLLERLLREQPVGKVLPLAAEYYHWLYVGGGAGDPDATPDAMLEEAVAKALGAVFAGDAPPSKSSKSSADEDVASHAVSGVELLALAAAFAPRLFQERACGELAMRHQSLLARRGRFGVAPHPSRLTDADVRSMVVATVACALTHTKRTSGAEALPEISTDPKVLRRAAALYETAERGDRTLGLQIVAVWAWCVNTQSAKLLAKLVDVVMPGVLAVWRAIPVTDEPPTPSSTSARPFWEAAALRYLDAGDGGTLPAHPADADVTDAFLCVECVLALAATDRKDVFTAFIAEKEAAMPWLRAICSASRPVPQWFTHAFGGPAALEAAVGALVEKVDALEAAEAAERERREAEEAERMRVQLEEEERKRVAQEKAAKQLEEERLRKEKEKARLEAEVKRKMEAERKAAAKEEKKRRDAQAELVRQAQKAENAKRKLEEDAQRARDAERAKLEHCLAQDRECVATLTAIGVASQKAVQSIKTCRTHDTDTLIQWLVCCANQDHDDSRADDTDGLAAEGPAGFTITGSGAVKYKAVTVPMSKRPFDPNNHRAPLLPMGHAYGFEDPPELAAASDAPPHHPVPEGEEDDDDVDVDGHAEVDEDDDYQDFWAIDVDLSKNLASFSFTGDDEEDDPDDDVDDLDPEDVAITREEEGRAESDHNDDDDDDDADDVMYAHAQEAGGEDGACPPQRTTAEYKEMFLTRRAELEARHPQHALRSSAAFPPWHLDYAPLLDLLDFNTNERVKFTDIKRYLRRDLGPRGYSFAPFPDAWAFVEGLQERGLVKLAAHAGVLEQKRATVALTKFGRHYHQRFWDASTSVAHRKPIDKAMREERREARRRQEADARKRALDTLLSMQIRRDGDEDEAEGEEAEEVDPAELNLPDWFFEAEIADHERAVARRDAKHSKGSAYTDAELEALQLRAMEKRRKRLERAIAEANGTACPVVQRRKTDKKKEKEGPVVPKQTPEEIAAANRISAAERAAERKEVELQARKREEEAEKANKRAQANRNKKPEVYWTATRKLYCFCAAWVAFMLFLVATSK